MNFPLNVLIVDDSEDDTELIMRILSQNAPNLTYKRVETAKDMQYSLENEYWDIVICDYIIPGFGGMEALELSKKFDKELPVILVSGKIGEEIAVNAMRAGAQDYILKDNLSRLVPAIEREITEFKKRKNNKIALKKSENFYKTIFENTGTATAIINENMIIEMVNSGFEDISGYKKSEIEGKIKFTDFTMQKDKKVIKNYMCRASNNTKKETKNFETIFIDAFKNHKDIFMTIAFIPDTKKILTSILDISENKKSQIALRLSEEKLRIITNNMLDLIVQTDFKGNYLYVSPSIRIILGYEPEYMLKRSIFDFLHPEDIESFKLKFFNEIKDISPNKLQHRYKNVNGNYIWLETFGNPLFDDNKLKGIVFSIRDVTDRKIAKDKLIEALSEKEILLKEIHHRVKNNLQIISSLLRLQSRYIEDEKIGEILNDSQNRVRSMSMVHEKLYQSEDLSKIDLEEYVNNLVTELFRSYSKSAGRVKLNVEVCKILIDADKAINFGLIINELLSNSLKHAFPDNREGEIFVKFYQNRFYHYILKIIDNGIGLPDDFDCSNSKSLGMRLINNLCNQLNGDMEIICHNGTTFVITFKSLF
ncbi:MAG: PAS domain S-box protein [Methanomicrobiales archaeon]